MMRVPLFLQDHRVPFETTVHPPAFTSTRRAKHMHVPGKNLAKSVLLARPRGYLLAVLPAIYHVDLPALSACLEQPVSLAADTQIGEIFRDCEFGVLMPFGSLYGIPTLLDHSIDPESDIVFQSHSHMWTIRMSCRDYERLEQPRRVHLARRS